MFCHEYRVTPTQPRVLTREMSCHSGYWLGIVIRLGSLRDHVIRDPELPLWRHAALNPAVSLSFLAALLFTFPSRRHFLHRHHTSALGDELTRVAQASRRLKLESFRASIGQGYQATDATVLAPVSEIPVIHFQDSAIPFRPPCRTTSSHTYSLALTSLL